MSHELVVTQAEEAFSNESEQPPGIVPTRIESRDLSSISQEMTDAIRGRIKPSLYERLRKEMGIT